MIPLNREEGETSFDLPGEFQNADIVVELEAEGSRKSHARYANTLEVQTIENHGRLRVTAEKSPVSKAYVKVYARSNDAVRFSKDGSVVKAGKGLSSNGAVRFYKDGYTDLRGCFDYVSLSTDDLESVERFSILVMSPEHGSVKREAAPPKR